MPKPRKPEQSNLACTLDAIAGLPDEAIVAWGKAFDWTQPVECVVPAPHGSTLVVRNAGEVLLRRRDPRLNRLLLHSQMFDMEGRWKEGSYRLLLSEHDEPRAEPFYSEDTMLHKCLNLALELSDIESASMMDKALAAPNQFGAMRRFFVNLPATREKGGLFANKEPDPVFREAVEFCERAVVRDARHFRRGSRRKVALFEQDHLQAWRHWMCVAALRVDSPRLFQHMHAAAGHPCTIALKDEALFGGRWDALEQLCVLGRSKGVIKQSEWIANCNPTPGAAFKSAGAGNTPELTMEVALSSQSQSWQHVACKVLDGAFDLPGEAPCSDAFIPMLLARRAGEWEEPLRAALNERFPVATMQEMCHLLLAGADEQDWQARKATLSARSPQVLWSSLAETLHVGHSIGEWLVNHGEDRMGQLLALAPEAMDSIRPAMGHHADKVQAAMQRHMLDRATTPGAAPSRSRRV